MLKFDGWFKLEKEISEVLTRLIVDNEMSEGVGMGAKNLEAEQNAETWGSAGLTLEAGLKEGNEGK